MARWSTDKGLDPDDAARRVGGSDYDEPFLPRREGPDPAGIIIFAAMAAVVVGLVALMWWVV